ncbi:MAG: hypothetical protein D3922_09095, partial [Candidatus Electrothrix sp. AR1]|nr:hypothetical protein [Candidatus Electrothrix sp. AR1]
MKLNKVMMFITLLVFIGALFVVAGLENGTQEAVADENPTAQAAVQEEVTQKKPLVQKTAAQQKAPVQENQPVVFPDYKIGLFNHKAHVTGASLQCTACHNGIFQMSASTAKVNDDFNKISFGEGKYCGARHNGTKSFAINDKANCSRCHKNDTNPPDTILL